MTFSKLFAGALGVVILFLATGTILVAAPPTQAPVNVALGKLTAQTSTMEDACNPTSDKAVDGNTSGVFSDCSIASTQTDPPTNQPAWTVDLGQIYPISTIVVWNRTDCCSERLHNLAVLVSQDGETWSKFSYEGTAGTSTTFEIHAPARYVGIKLYDDGILALAEVQVMSEGETAPTETTTDSAANSDTESPTAEATSTVTETTVITATNTVTATLASTPTPTVTNTVTETLASTPTQTPTLTSTLPNPTSTPTGTAVPCSQLLAAQLSGQERCKTTLLFPYVTNQGGFDTGISISNTSADTFGTPLQNGNCTLTYFGTTTGGGAAPAAQTTTSAVSAGGQLVFTLSSGGTNGIAATPGFQGYIFATCNFLYAHGYAFISDVGTQKLAQGYLALVVPQGKRDPYVESLVQTFTSAPNTSGSAAPNAQVVCGTNNSTQNQAAQARCKTTLLFPFVTNQGGFDTGIALSNTSADTFGTPPQNGNCTLTYFGTTTGGGSAPAGQTTTAPIAAGGQLVFTLSGGGTHGIAATPGFQGYILATCNFLYAHGYAFISDIGTQKLAEGYLSLVLPQGARDTAVENLGQ